MPTSALAVAGTAVPTAGRWRVEGDALRFSPRFPLPADTGYSLVRPIRGPGPTSWVEVARVEPSGAQVLPTASVVAIHPSGDEVPENLLRVSVTFSAPMDEGSAAGHVRLEDGHGQEVRHALLPMPPELWDRPRRRLTLLLEPGRIKRGLVPNAALGPPLAGLRTVDVVVDPTVRDGEGTGLVAGARHRYRVGPASRSRVDPERWRVTWPRPGSQDTLVVDLDRALDHALALRCLRVATVDGASVPGRAALGPGEVRWLFVPAARWPAEGVRLHVDATLEDLAGNSVRRVFDRDLRRRQDDPLDVTEVVLRPGRAGPALPHDVTEAPPQP